MGLFLSRILGTSSNGSNDKALYLVEGLRKDAKLSKYSISNVSTQ